MMLQYSGEVVPMAFSLKKIFGSNPLIKEKSDRSIVGIDVGSSSIKVVELVPRDDYVMLKSYGELQLGPYADKPLGSIVDLDKEQQIAALVDVIRESDVVAKEGVLALPLAMSFVTIVPVAVSESEEKLEARMQVEARKYIPVPLSEVILDWTALPVYSNGDIKEETDKKQDVLIVAVQKDSFQEINDTMEALQLQSRPTEIELFCAQRALGDAKHTQVIIDIGAQILKVYLFDGGLIRKVHRVYCGGAEVTRRYAEEKGMEFDDAEEFKRSSEAADDEALRSITEQVYQRAFIEITKVLRNFEQLSGTKVDLVTVTGGEALSIHVRAQLSEMIGRKVVVGNCFDKVAYPAFMEDVLTEIAPSFSVALGAALRGVNASR